MNDSIPQTESSKATKILKIDDTEIKRNIEQNQEDTYNDDPNKG